jgi:hypothetical protein
MKFVVIATPALSRGKQSSFVPLDCRVAALLAMTKEVTHG